MKLPTRKLQTKTEYVGNVLILLHKDNLPFVKVSPYHLKLNDINFYPTANKIVFDNTHKVVMYIFNTNQIKGLIENFEPTNDLRYLKYTLS